MVSWEERARYWVHDAADEAARDAIAEQCILLVEDDPEVLEVLGLLLHFEHYRVAFTADGQEALDWLARRRPALMIVDWLLPTIGGAGVVAAVRARYGATVPILVLSAVANPEAARRAGADAYLRKPCLTEQLVGTIHQLLAV